MLRAERELQKSFKLLRMSPNYFLELFFVKDFSITEFTQAPQKLLIPFEPKSKKVLCHWRARCFARCGVGRTPGALEDFKIARGRRRSELERCRACHDNGENRNSITERKVTGRGESQSSEIFGRADLSSFLNREAPENIETRPTLSFIIGNIFLTLLPARHWTWHWLIEINWFGLKLVCQRERHRSK